ncbi:COX15/CtaA family protein [Salinimonas sediminis]|uniref:Heme A synthase n=1 Tax=Salinimonas sediminis TaxID=2303538 RepID=A0A346NHG6_9ALTE|nr:COX15/CtaA family protein [Salinimonas sediminis]AXR04973.1 heme A synthase [Salinimonas sediminis]
MKKLIFCSLMLAVIVIVLGAYTRLTDAGLGCPDWPGCYGELFVPASTDKVAAANAAFPARPVEASKAWSEMIHRYFAGTLGLLIFSIAAWAAIKRDPRMPLGLPLFLCVLVVFQAALGMWTVTLNLLPVAVMGHLMGGFGVLACLFVMHLRVNPITCRDRLKSARRLLGFAFVGMFILGCQIALGGWTSANYAALACTNFPVCEGQWWTQIDLPGAYTVPVAANYEFGVHGYSERMTMHIIHRAGALVTFVYLLTLGIWLLRTGSKLMNTAGAALIVVLSAQVLLGISNVVMSLPLTVAVAHNFVAACLLLVMVWIIYQLSHLEGGTTWLNRSR